MQSSRRKVVLLVPALMVAVAVVGAAAWSMRGLDGDANLETHIHMRQLLAMAQDFKLRNGRWPSQPFAAKLAADAARFGYELQGEQFLDAWEREIKWASIDNGRSLRCSSAGGDGVWGTIDDLSAFIRDDEIVTEQKEAQ